MVNRAAETAFFANAAVLTLCLAACGCARADGIPPDFKPRALVRYLDPYTKVCQTDAPDAGGELSQNPGWWPVPCGLYKPDARRPAARVVHAVFTKSAEPFPEYDASKPSPLFKINQVGYIPGFPKFAYVGAWLGPSFGAWAPKRPMGSWRVADAATGETVFSGAEPPRLRVPDVTTKEGTPFSGEDTYEMDFSALDREGTYYIEIPGVGRSAEFKIAKSAAEDAFRVHMGGLYQKRCGIAKEEPWTHWTAPACHCEVVRGTFPPEEGKFDIKKIRMFDVIRANTDWDDGERLRLPGGWHDAADYDRRPAHLNVVNDLCAVYLMRPGNFRDGQLSIPESANGIPDILDEAEWGLRHILAGQQPDGGAGTWIESTRHPRPGEPLEPEDMRYALSRPTRRSSLMYAAHAAQLARCHPSFRVKYLESAKRAWNFALNAKPQTATFWLEYTTGRFFKKTERKPVEWTEDADLPAAYLVKAAVNLHALTGDESFFKPVLDDMPRLLHDVKHNAWNWPPLVFSGEIAGGLPPGFKEFFTHWERRTKNVADEICRQVDSVYAYRAPWWPPRKGWVNAMGWGQSHPLRRAQYLVAAHGMTGDARYLKAASLANDFHNGCNPQGTTLTSGLGRVYPVAFLDLPSYVDGIAEYVPGISPYRWNYVIPPKVVEMVWNGDKERASKWPIWRRWGNLENLTVKASEYTVWETIAPAASVTGYLAAPSDTRPAPRPSPAKDIRDLPGYWLLP